MDKYNGAVLVLENYLDGAVADFESGNIDFENMYAITNCISAIKLLGSVDYLFYRDRMKEAIKNKVDKEITDLNNGIEYYESELKKDIISTEISNYMKCRISQCQERIEYLKGLLKEEF